MAFFKINNASCNFNFNNINDIFIILYKLFDVILNASQLYYLIMADKPCHVYSWIIGVL